MRLIAGLVALLLFPLQVNAESKSIHIGSRLELMVDDFLIEKMSGKAELRLHKPVRREVSLVTDKPWEGNACHYRSVFQDGDRYRMYYGAYQYDVQEKKQTYPHPVYLCYAESRDGIHWTRPELGLVEFEGSTKNNIVLSTESIKDAPVDPNHCAVFLDTNPGCKPDARYKAIIRDMKGRGLYALKSADGIHFSLISPNLIITEGVFDSQNLAFWDSDRQMYRAYFRDFDKHRRVIMTSTSDDFTNWTKPVPLRYPGSPVEQLYTNQIVPYVRAPHLLFGFPMRYRDRGWTESTRRLPGYEQRRMRSSVSQRFGTTVTDALIMTSRDGVVFKRWGEAFLRPGPSRTKSWVYGDNSIAWGMVATKSSLPQSPDELSIYATEGYWAGKSLNVRRYSMRVDGFVSVQAPLSGGEFITKPVVFKGSKLVLNYSTSAAGGLWVELQGPDGKPLEGFSLESSDEIFGDEIERTVTWTGSGDVSRLSGKPIRLRFVLKDADLFSLRFQ